MNPDLVLVDTSVWILSLSRKVPPAVKSRLDQLLEENLVATNQMVRLELLAGTRSTVEFNETKSDLDALHQLEIGNAEWDQAADLAFELRRKGKTLPYTDILIAVTALRHGVSLMHCDQHYDVIAETTGLMTENLVRFTQR